ncbi:MAG: PASTA domain-containing protein [Ignavibacteriales bacterium]|nr:MAG: PASTA domain-containing protein [Ignavibacteriales bacterium]
MKKLLARPFIRKSLYILGSLIILFLIADNLLIPWYVNKAETKVPNVVGMEESQAMQMLEDYQLEPVVSESIFDERFPKGSIILQKPEGGKIVKEGRRVYLFVSGGEPTVYVPRLRGKSIRDARLSLERVGLKLGSIEELPSTNPKNMIFDQQYAEGTPLKKGESVNVTISSGESDEGITVPDLIGKSLAEAQRILADSTLRVGKINYQRSFSLLPNTILDQYPSKGNKVKSGDAIDLFVTKAAEAPIDNEIREE